MRFSKQADGWHMWDSGGNHYIFSLYVSPSSPGAAQGMNHAVNHDKLYTYYLKDINDPYGHTVHLDYQIVTKDVVEDDGTTVTYREALPTAIQDSTGRAITFTNEAKGNGYYVVTRIALPTIAGATTTNDYVLDYLPYDLYRTTNDTLAVDRCGDPCGSFDGRPRRLIRQIPFLTAIHPPAAIPNPDGTAQDNGTYDFTYWTTGNYADLLSATEPQNAWGEPKELSGVVRTVGFPTGGGADYVYKDRLQMTSTTGGGRSCQNDKYCQFLLEKSYFTGKFAPLAVYTKTLHHTVNGSDRAEQWKYKDWPPWMGDCVNGGSGGNYHYLVVDVIPPADPYDKADRGYYQRNFFYQGFADVLFGFLRKTQTLAMAGTAPAMNDPVVVERTLWPDWDHELEDPGTVIDDGNYCALATSTRYDDVDYNVRTRKTTTGYFRESGGPDTTVAYSADWDRYGHYEKETTCESPSCAAPKRTETDYTPDVAGWILNKFTSVKKSVDPAADKNALTGYEFDALGRITDSCTFEDYVNQTVTDCGAWDFKRHYGYNAEGFLSGIEYWRKGFGTTQPEYTETAAYTCGVPAVKQFSGAPFKSIDRTVDCRTGWITSERDPAGIQTSLQYDSLGRVLKILPSNGEAQTWVNYINPNHTNVETIDAGAAVTTSDHYFDRLGRKTVTVRDNWSTGTGTQNYKSVMQVTSYSPQGKVFHTSEWLKANCDETTCPHLQTVTGDPPTPANTSLPGTLNLDFDEQSRFTLQYRPNPSATRGYDDTTITYDGITHKTITESDVSGSPVQTHYFYDLLGRLTQVWDALGGSAEYAYDHRDRLRHVYQYGSGAVQERTFDYNDLGNLTAETHPELDQSIQYTGYDALANLKSKTDANGTAWSYGYDPAGRLLTVHRKTSQETAEALYQEFVYDALPGFNACLNPPSSELGWACGKLIQSTQYYPRPDTPTANHLNLRHQYRYFGLNGRLSKHTFYSNFLGDPDGTGAYLRLTWGYEYNTQGLLWRLYYPLPHLNTEVFPPDTLDFPEFDNRAMYTYKMGQAHTLKRQRKSGSTWVTADIVTGTSYFPGGLPEFLEFNGGAVADKMEIDPSTMQNRPKRISFTKGTETLWDSGTMRYDGVGNIRTIGADGFQYDPLSRLDYAFVTPHDGTDPVSRTYEYDPFGNMLKNGPHKLNVNGETHFAKNRLPATIGGSYPFAGYDAAGNLTSFGLHQYRYEAANRMVEYKHTDPEGGLDSHEDYWYDTDGERLLSCNRADGGNQNYDKPTLFIRDESGNVLAEFGMPAANSYCPEEAVGPGIVPQPTVVPMLEWKKDHYYFNGKLAATERVDGDNSNCRQWAFYHSDHLGTPRMITDENGNAPRFFDYAPYGEELSAQGQNDLTHKYTGHERDFESNLDYMHARYLNNFLGRFLSPDTIRGNPIDPQLWNLYTYVRNNPMLLVDPDGRDWYNVNGKWLWQQTTGTQNFNIAGKNVKVQGYKNLVVVQQIGKNKLGAATFKMTLYNQNKIAAAGSAFSGGNGQQPIPSGNYSMNTAIRNAPPTLGRPDEDRFGYPREDYGIQDIAKGWFPIEGYPNARTDFYSTWGPQRAYLQPDVVSEDRSNTGMYYHGKAVSLEEGWTHGCLSYGNDPKNMSVINYLWEQTRGKVPMSVNTPVEEPK